MGIVDAGTRGAVCPFCRVPTGSASASPSVPTPQPARNPSTSQRVAPVSARVRTLVTWQFSGDDISRRQPDPPPPTTTEGPHP